MAMRWVYLPRYTHRIAKTVKGFFDVGTPRFLIKTVPEFCPCVGIAQFTAGRWKEQFSLPVVRFEISKELTTEFRSKHFHWNKKACGRHLEIVIFSQTATCDDAVDVRMEI